MSYFPQPLRFDYTYMLLTHVKIAFTLVTLRNMDAKSHLGFENQEVVRPNIDPLIHSLTLLNPYVVIHTSC